MSAHNAMTHKHGNRGRDDVTTKSKYLVGTPSIYQGSGESSGGAGYVGVPKNIRAMANLTEASDTSNSI